MTVSNFIDTPIACSFFLGNVVHIGKVILTGKEEGGFCICHGDLILFNILGAFTNSINLLDLLLKKKCRW